MKIGNIALDAPLALAPMAGISDLPYRVLCRRCGAGLTVSEMVSAKGLLYKNEKTFAMLAVNPSGANGVDDVLGFKIKAWGNDR